MSRYDTKDHSVATHNGIQPTLGMWLYVPVREALFKKLQDMRSNGEQFAIMENIKHLPALTLTRVRFDVDLHLTYGAANLLVPYIERFVSCLYKVLYETTTLTPDCESRIIVQRKPEPTNNSYAKEH